MENYVNILIKRIEMVKNWKEYVTKIAEAAKSILPDSEIYVFGSVVKGDAIGGSDVDILIISEGVSKSNLERAKIKVKIEELLNLPSYHPFEIHLVNKEEGEWYLKRIKELVKY
jgi:predicted nucleotidyltransferase